MVNVIDKTIQYDEIENWMINYPVLINNEKSYKDCYPIRIYSDGFDYIDITIDKKLYHYLRLNFKLKDLDIDALQVGFIVVKKHSSVVLCNFEYCSKRCRFYSQCSYCVMKKLQEASA